MPIQLSSLIPSGGSVEDNREFKNWQDWVGNSNDGHSNIGRHRAWFWARPLIVAPAVPQPSPSLRRDEGPRDLHRRRWRRWQLRLHYYGGKGGGGGCFASGEYTVSPGDRLNVTVGVAAAAAQKLAATAATAAPLP